jgi:hypothetical protein
MTLASSCRRPHPRIGDTLRKVVSSDYMGEVISFGKDDHQATAEHLATGERFKGGFVIHFISRQQTMTLRPLLVLGKDVTSNRNER